MDDRQKLGEVFHKLGLSQAIERKLLTDYQAAVIGVDDATYREWAERGTFVKEYDQATWSDSMAAYGGPLLVCGQSGIRW
jgi:predicted helicase